MSRAKASVLVAAAVAAVLAGCGERVDDADRLEVAIDDAIAVAGRFSYREETAERTVAVEGIVEDDFRFKAALQVDGRPLLEQVVSDDALAVRLLADGALDDVVDPIAVDLVDTATDAEGVTTLDALAARRWVLDLGGAPASVVSDETLSDLGDDPVLDARTVLPYVRRVIQNGAVIRYKQDATQPAFPGDEDVFAQPEEGSGVTRYDVPTLDLPSVSASTSGTPAFPGPTSFRKMVVYVDDGRVVRVEERTEIVGDQVQDVADYLFDLLRTTNGEALAEQFRASFEATPDDEVEAFLFGGINTIRELAGEEPVRPRRMVYEREELDAADLRVELPDDVISGDLAVLANLGRKPAEVRDAQDDADEVDGGAAGAPGEP